MKKRTFPDISNIFVPKIYHYPIEWCKYQWRKAKWTRQRKHQGFSDYDVWELGSYITVVMKNGLRQLAQEHFGVPQNFIDQANGDVEAADRNYTDYLNQIADLLEETEKDIETVEDVARRQLSLCRALDMLKTVYFDLWD